MHGDKLDNLRGSLKMLDVLSGNRGLQDIVEETINMRALHNTYKPHSPDSLSVF